MKAQVKSDDTRRTISIDVSGVPDIDVTRSYHKKPRVFRPDRVSLTLTNGALGGITISGYLVLKSGGTSDAVRESQRWYSVRDPNTMPGWLQLLIEEAPAGVTGWSQPEPVAL
jgi:SH3-like domain-containing protein